MSITRVPFRITDCFALALDGLMRRTGQAGHVSQSVLALDRAPDLEKLRAGLVRVVAKHPILVARHRRNWVTRMPYWAMPAPPDCGLPLGLWRETDAPGPPLEGAASTSDARETFQRILAEPLARDGIHFNARMDVAQLREGGWLAALSWSHLLLDGKGAELLFVEIARLCEGMDLPHDFPEPPKPRLTLAEKLKKTRPVMDRFGELQATGIPSLGGPWTRTGRGFYEVLMLDDAESALVRERAEQMGGALFPATFYVSCVARAHDLIFRRRGREPRGLGVSVPIQTRKRGARGPIFHNHVTVLYFHPRREHLDSLAETAAAMKAQFAAMTRGRISESFDAVLELMMRVPSWLFMWIIRLQFKGEICTCFFSHTGPFAPELTNFVGARIANAYHLPALGTPPGTGIFFGERDGRINVTLSWRQGAITEEERRLMAGQMREDLLGEKPSAPAAHGL
jgi:hypothetical protein